MARFSIHDRPDYNMDDFYPEEPEPEKEMTCEPDSRLTLEASGSERFPTFKVYLVMNKEELGQRVFESESEALLCLETLYPILGKEPSVALEEFLAWIPE
jgi:hypothetical protein